MHTKCRNSAYGSNSVQNVERFPVPDDKVCWSEEWADYKPFEFTHSTVLSLPPWADPENALTLQFNTVDGSRTSKVDRRSHIGKYTIEPQTNRPVNPEGRTGISGRGLLGKWGPNHAADAIVTRFNPENRDLEFIAIKRKDSGEWAIPGGMVDSGEKVSTAVTRELAEEALGMGASAAAASYVNELLSPLAKLIYQGYVDDPRNTDNAWMETSVYNFHDNDNSVCAHFDLKAGDDAVNVQWMSVKQVLNERTLYASHAEFIDLVSKMHPSPRD
ncbi:hypothetical protein ACOME3_003731 [Neoechinorhynchus agilis]